MRTTTSILSSELCRDLAFRLEVRFVLCAGVQSGVQEEGSGEGVRQGMFGPGTVNLAPLEQLGAELAEEDWLVLLVFLEGWGEEGAEEMCWDISGFFTYPFSTCRFFAIFMNLWMMRAFRIPSAMIGPTRRIISLTMRYTLNTIFSETSKFSSDFQTQEVFVAV